MDDFGTGYSGLNYLRKYLFDRIKIDRSFVAEMSSRLDSAGIIRAVFEMAGALNVTTTAEGVESEAQLEQLLMAGCTEAQGYLFGRPQPASELLSLIYRFEENAVAA